MGYTKTIIDGVVIETRKFEMGFRTEKSRIKKYIGIGVFILIAAFVSFALAEHQANASIKVYENYLKSN